jgi:DNA-binding CsgD family transcriptional regulator
MPWRSGVASNGNIFRCLSISRPTLRTHLNNIYHALRDRREAPEFMLAGRLPRCHVGQRQEI